MRTNSARSREKVAPADALRDMLIEACGIRGWNDTRESWLARGARICGISPRQARRIFYRESFPSGRVVFMLCNSRERRREVA